MAYVIRVVDTETTGFAPPATPVEVAYCDLTRHDGGEWTIGSPVSWLCGADTIPPETRAVHHIGLGDVEGLPAFGEADILRVLAGADAVAAHCWEFDSQWIDVRGAVPTICTLKSAYRVWPDAPGHSNGVLRYWLEDRGLLSLDHATAMPPHRAGPDAYVTAHILKALFAAGATGQDLVTWTKEPRLLPTCPIGKFRGKPWADVEAGFLSWMLAQPTMDADLKWNAQRELDRRAGR